MLALALSGCFALGRESYTTLSGSGAAPVFAPKQVEVSNGRTGHGFAQDAPAARAGADVLVSVCDWDPGFWLLVFPPIPIPLLSMAEQPGLPDTTVVRVTFDGAGPWSASFADLALVGPESSRVTPLFYRVVLAAKAESLANKGADPRELEPCARAVDPKKSVDSAHVAVLEPGELWLTFDTHTFPKGPRRLELNGISRGDAAVPLPPLALEGGSRWFWYRLFP
ncbi:MAG: hypothetical protein ACHQ6T_10960 [Myxococcota bacterium]